MRISSDKHFQPVEAVWCAAVTRDVVPDFSQDSWWCTVSGRKRFAYAVKHKIDLADSQIVGGSIPNNRRIFAAVNGAITMAAIDHRLDFYAFFDRQFPAAVVCYFLLAAAGTFSVPAFESAASKAF